MNSHHHSHLSVPLRHFGLIVAPGIRQLEIAAQHVITHLFTRLREKYHRDNMRQGYGLCMKHFAPTYLIAPKDKTRALLAEIQRNRLIRLDSALASSDANADAHNLAWQAAVHRFCGFTQVADVNPRATGNFHS